MELKLASIHIGDAALREKPLLQRRVELSEAIPQSGDVLVPISDTDPSHVDAAD